MINIKRRSLNTVLIAIFATLLIFGNASADVQFSEEHHHHGGGDFDFGIWFGPEPYYYPYYSPYYYPNNYVIVSEPVRSAPAVDRSETGLLVMKAQVQLTSLGYYNGSVDGILGPQTKKALTAFQKNKGLAETGMLDEATMKALGISK